LRSGVRNGTGIHNLTSVSGEQSSILWFRRDLRRHDNPALNAAAASGHGSVIALFVLDERLWGPAGPVRRAYLSASLRALEESLDGQLVVRYGDPASVVPQVAAEAGADQVHCAADFAPYGSARDDEVAMALSAAGRTLVRTGSPYAVAPGRVRKSDGTPYRVYTPFFRAWQEHGWRAPAIDPEQPPLWRTARSGPLCSEGIPRTPDLGSLVLPTAGEGAASERWEAFVRDGLDTYDDLRNRPDLSATSAMSAHLKWGEIHPRTLLAELGQSKAHVVYRKELAWREFYADVLATAPATAWHNLDPRFEALPVDHGDAADARFVAWSQGATGYPFVDAGMRQLQAEGWIHNRVRMVVASFLVKDLHLPWQRGAAWFLRYLRDGDLASNQHGWQWTAGTGTDAAPYFRVFNPVLQGQKFDPDGNYVRRYIEQLQHLPGGEVHEPWRASDGYLHRYPERIVDHHEERAEALRRYEKLRDYA
jgi:deoxyribodipyrimidine photo-lyase